MLLSLYQVYAKMVDLLPDDSSSESGDETLQGDEFINNAVPSLTLKPAASPGSSALSEELTTMALPSARAYQLEMLEESLKRNVIVAMDTGSGKTRVAVLRIIRELERSEKMVWFLAPTVDLASQQHDVLHAQIPVVESKFICGADNVVAWSSQKVWDEVLRDIRIVVSTFQILFDAVQHGFVRLDSLSLLVIDEAHNCVKANSGARLMKEFYAPAKQANQTVPHILGLTASPIMRLNLDDIDILENTLDAVCKTPTKHRDELLRQVNRPKIMTIQYGDPEAPDVPYIPTRTIASLRRVYHELDIKTDPYILQLLARRNTKRDQDELRKAVLQNDTYSQRQMKSFCGRADEICRQIGPWAADYYIYRVILEFTKSTADTGALLEDLSEQERVYLGGAFGRVQVNANLGEPSDLSLKMNALLGILQEDRENPMGIVFVKERATVAVLSHVLSVHPLTKGRYRVGSVVGASKMPGKRRDFLDLSSKEDVFSLENFRTGKFNLLVATSVLEEGIDVPACNLVICFDDLTSPKAFIQRRGRARMTTSQFYLLVEDMESESAKKWVDAERKMKERYEDEMRDRKIIEDIEESEIGLAEYEVLVVPSTGARLTIRDAKSHLQHFCASLSSRKFVDWNPYYVFHDVNGNPVVDVTQEIPMRATVHLPASLDPSLRKFDSLNVWPSEKNACMDAAFQAYKALYNAGLISDNLLPLRDADILGEVEQRAGYCTVGEQLNPWYAVARAWQSNPDDQDMFKRRLTISNKDQSVSAEFEMVLPVPIPHMERLTIWWDRHSSWSVTMGEEMVEFTRGSSHANYRSPAPDDTSTLLSFAFGYRFRTKPLHPQKQYPFRLVSPDQKINSSSIGGVRFDPDLVGTLLPGNLVRDILDCYHPYHYIDVLPNKPAIELIGRPYKGFELAPENIPYVVLRTWPRKAGFFRLNTSINQEALGSSKPYPRVLPANQVRVDNIPPIYTQIGMLLPAITRALEIHLVASDLMEYRLGELEIEDLDLVVTAICATSAKAWNDYERVEFLGDSILKFCASVNAGAKNLLWPEGYLSLYKDKIVANSSLARAAVRFGLDRYIIYQPFTVNKWKPVYVEDLVLEAGGIAGERELPTKTLADVVEALIGVCFVLGGYDKALRCIETLLPFNKQGDKWMSIEQGRGVLYENARRDYSLPVTMRGLEELIGYRFKKKSLLVEAMTHCSWTGGDGVACLDRLEFLGDSVLDLLVVRELFGMEREGVLENFEMHLLRTSAVNGDLLAFLVMEWEREEEGEDIGGVRNRVPLWAYMRHSSMDMGFIQMETEKRYNALRGEINEGLFGKGKVYPWEGLLRLQAQKFYSDLFESLLGAVWVDSGSMEECQGVVERVGILRLVRRLRGERVWVLHPKEELGRLAVGEKVVYEVEEEEEGKEQGEERTFRCVVFVGERRVCEVGGAFRKEESRVRGAREAVRILKGGMEMGK